MDLRIRKAQLTDLEPLAALARKTYADAFGYSLRPSDLAAHLESKLSDACFRRYLADDTFLLAEVGAVLVGFVQFGAARPDPQIGRVSPGDAELRRLYVLSQYQKRGIARRLIDAALETSIARAAGNIFLDVWEDNVVAHRLYESFGFTTIGKRRFAVASGSETGFDFIMVRRATRA